MPRKQQDADVVPIRRTSPMKGRKQNEAQRAAFERGRAKRDENNKKRREAREAGVPTRASLLLDGKITVKDMDDEELSRMRCRDRAGGFSGGTPSWPAHLARQMQRELIRRGGDEFSGAYLLAIKTLKDIAKDPSEKAADRVKAAVTIIERVSGKVPEKVLHADGTWDETFEDIILSVRKEQEETG